MRPISANSRGLSLVEILIVMVVISVLATLGGAGYANAMRQARNIKCLQQMRTLGDAIRLYAQDNNGEFPRSIHSAYANRQRGWSREVLPYLSKYSNTPSTTEWSQAVKTFLRCPIDERTNANVWSYGLNVFFELDPTGDDYEGSPATWRRLVNVGNPSQTILLAESRNNSVNIDHFMAQNWDTLAAAANAVDSTRHGKTSNFVFVEGHAESLTLDRTYNPSTKVNCWNPSLTR